MKSPITDRLEAVFKSALESCRSTEGTEGYRKAFKRMIAAKDRIEAADAAAESFDAAQRMRHENEVLLHDILAASTRIALFELHGHDRERSLPSRETAIKQAIKYAPEKAEQKRKIPDEGVRELLRDVWRTSQEERLESLRDRLQILRMEAKEGEGWKDGEPPSLTA